MRVLSVILAAAVWLPATVAAFETKESRESLIETKMAVVAAAQAVRSARHDWEEAQELLQHAQLSVEVAELELENAKRTRAGGRTYALLRQRGLEASAAPPRSESLPAGASGASLKRCRGRAEPDPARPVQRGASETDTPEGRARTLLTWEGWPLPALSGTAEGVCHLTRWV